MRFVALDTETTGLPPNAHLLEIAAVDVDRITSRFHSFANPGRPIPKFVSRLTGIQQHLVAGALPPNCVVDRFLRWLPMANEVVLVAHNVRFESAVLESAIASGSIRRRLSLEWIDTVMLARELNETEDFKLSTIARTHGWSMQPVHRAVLDAELVRLTFLRARRILPEKTLNRFRQRLEVAVH
ncbi:DNA polymerase III PolC-type [Planctomycetes bacterium Pan216]|uniref:DNA polymerase III PolC-type n=1 Tax=Kolteria novifilia TaxID=2527975 RepID=A0A518B0J8_9BACT|nr:DNA polymerase III PolC-type [Planctomycetes bacterium Pan216]